ncbi:hypothetical protein FQN51_009306 [Onygenales sp. PD_10]|nr:hypothetical protein FQN51_009306 [Onygenales sp. PD_10]
MSFRRAFALSEGEVCDATPPGTDVLVDHTATDLHLELVPKPSLDPADPLNWPLWRKLAILFCMSLYAFVANFTSASLSSALPIMATPLVFRPPIPMSRLTHLIAVNVLMLGAGNIWNVPLAHTFGRRPVILINLLLLTLSSMWAGLAKEFNNLLAARFFIGIGGSAADAVAPDVVGEIFFVHQRGRAMACYTVFLACGSLVGGTSGSYIVAMHGYEWLHWTNVIFSAITLALCFVFQSETLFDRVSALAVSGEERPGSQSNADQKPASAEGRASFPPYTFSRSLRMWTYRPGLLRRFLTPLMTLRFPGVWLVMLWYAGLVGGIVTISTVGPGMVAAPPYLWGRNAGLINIGGIIGTLLGTVYCYYVADFAVKQHAKKESHGFAEPEARLWTALPGLFLATTGLWVFGFSGNNPGGNSWVGLQFGGGMLAFGLMQVPSIGFNYIIDSYNPISGDCFVAITFMRSVRQNTSVPEKDTSMSGLGILPKANGTVLISNRQTPNE